MKELAVDFSVIYPDIICFASSFYWDENIFLVSKNSETTESGLKIQKYFLNLKYNLDLKYFKIEIFE
jgi:hypothetical protein